MSLLTRLNSPGPKRILTLDGGGVRGAIALGYLQRLESILAKQNNDPDLRLSDYFDLVGGTSTGSILASCIALGMKMSDLKTDYFKVIDKIFAKKNTGWMPWDIAQKIVNLLFSKADYDSTPIEEALQSIFGDITLGSDKFKCGLCIIAKRADTNSTWPLLNHPGGKYFDCEDGRNKDILLWNAVRASAAAPTYFIPQLIDVGGGMPSAAFVDGGMTMANNPSLLTLMVATLSGFPFKWKMGADKLLLVSIGTGYNKTKKIAKDIARYQEFKWASEIPDMLMEDASWQNQAILQWFSKSPCPWIIDGEMGDLCEDLISPGDTGNGLISYLRYNACLAKDELDKLMSKSYTPAQVTRFNMMDHAENCQELFEIASVAAEKQMQESHFPEAFRL